MSISLQQFEFIAMDHRTSAIWRAMADFQMYWHCIRARRNQSKLHRTSHRPTPPVMISAC